MSEPRKKTAQAVDSNWQQFMTRGVPLSSTAGKGKKSREEKPSDRKRAAPGGKSEEKHTMTTRSMDKKSAAQSKTSRPAPTTKTAPAATTKAAPAATKTAPAMTKTAPTATKTAPTTTKTAPTTTKTAAEKLGLKRKMANKRGKKTKKPAIAKEKKPMPRPLLIPLHKPIPAAALKPAVTASSSSSSSLSMSEPAIVDEKPPCDPRSLTRVLAIDCEMVGVGKRGSIDILGAVCIVNEHGKTVYFSYVAPTEPVVDYRTQVSGIRPGDLVGAPQFEVVQRDVAAIIKDRIVTGHGLENDFVVLKLRHPAQLTRDTAEFEPLKNDTDKPRRLQWLAERILNRKIQEDEHNPAEDALASMQIYKKLEADWEQRIEEKLKAQPWLRSSAKRSRKNAESGQLAMKKMRRK